MRDITFDRLLSQLEPLAASPARSLAGASGAKKYHIAAFRAEKLNDTQPAGAAVLPMNWVPLDDTLLEPRGDLPRKGAPHTYDIGGGFWCLKRRQDAAEPVAVPVFDRRIEIAHAGVRLIWPEGSRFIVRRTISYSTGRNGAL